MANAGWRRPFDDEIAPAPIGLRLFQRGLVEIVRHRKRYAISKAGIAALLGWVASLAKRPAAPIAATTAKAPGFTAE